jgi:hypothetical protein
LVSESPKQNGSLFDMLTPNRCPSVFKMRATSVAPEQHLPPEVS